MKGVHQYFDGWLIVNILFFLTPATESTYEEVKQEIEKTLLYQKQNEVFSNKIKELYLKYADSIKFN